MSKEEAAWRGVGQPPQKTGPEQALHVPGQVQRWIQPRALNARQALSYVGFRVYWGHLLPLAVLVNSTCSQLAYGI